jgi:hypothetical protein
MELPRGWYTAGGGVLWGDVSTYGLIPFDALPDLPGVLDGRFAWLRSAEPPPEGAMVFGPDEEHPEDPPRAALAARGLEAQQAGLALPPEFGAFLGDAALPGRVPSCTACYWELGARLLPVPGQRGPERLLRFMNDQQSCLAWYLLLEPGSRHRVAAATPRFRDDAEGDTFEDVVDPTEVLVCAPSFEAFVQRFWIENVIWYRTHEGRPLDAALAAYLDAARASGARPA